MAYSSSVVLFAYTQPGTAATWIVLDFYSTRQQRLARQHREARLPSANALWQAGWAYTPLRFLVQKPFDLSVLKRVKRHNAESSSSP
jgi:hypothetical protein